MFAQLLERLGRALDAAGLRYMVIGGQAVLLYGEPRLTRDIDITLDADVDQIGRVRRVADSLGLRPLVDPEKFTRETMVLPCEDPQSGIRVDFIFSFSRYEKEAMGRVRRVRLGSVDVSYASAEDVIIHKVVAGRPKDLEDARAILLKNPDVDTGYIRRWLLELSPSTEESLLARFENLGHI